MGVRSLQVRCEIGEVGVSTVIFGGVSWKVGLLTLVLGCCCFESWVEWFGSGVFSLGRRGEVFVRRDFWLKSRLVQG